MIFSTWQANFKAILTTRQTAAAAAAMYSYHTSYDNTKYTQTSETYELTRCCKQSNQS